MKGSLMEKVIAYITAQALAAGGDTRVRKSLKHVETISGGEQVSSRLFPFHTTSYFYFPTVQRQIAYCTFYFTTCI